MSMYVIDTTSPLFNPINIDVTRMCWRVVCGSPKVGFQEVYVSCVSKAGACVKAGSLGMPRLFVPHVCLLGDVPEGVEVHGL